MWFSDLRIVLADRVIENGALRVEAGRIAQISETPVADPDVRGGGLLLLPGFIDMHGDMVESAVEPRPNVRMPIEVGLRDLDLRLAAAGITTAYAALSFSPTSVHGHVRSFEHSTMMIRSLKAMRDQLLIDHKVHVRFEVTYPDALHVVCDLLADGMVDLLSLNDHTPGQGQYRDMERFIANMMRRRDMTYEEAVAATHARIAERTRPAEVLTATINDIVALCRDAGVPVASHDDDTTDKVHLMAEMGAAISEFPVTIEAAKEARQRGMAIAMGAPNALRGESYSGNLSAREAWSKGLLDILACDYHPPSMLPATLKYAEQAGLPTAVSMAARGAARALGLDDRGEIAPGRRADLIVVDPAGLGAVRATFCAGRPVFTDGWLHEARGQMHEAAA